MFTVLSIILFIFGQRLFLKPLLVIILFLSALTSYFNKSSGIIIDIDMIRNVAETIKDNNRSEVLELLSASLLLYVFIFAMIPSVLVFLIKIKKNSLAKDAYHRVLSILAITALAVMLLLLNFKYITYFSRENRDLRVWTTPIFPLISIYKFTQEHWKSSGIPFVAIGKNAKHEQKEIKTIGIMVVGETARLDHFSLNGYSRDTNAELKKENVISFNNVNSCGTSTAYSVPCMFSLLGQSDYSPQKAGHQSNVLDVLTSANINTIWIDNNSSCKGVCKRINSLNIRKKSKLKVVLSDNFNDRDGNYYDEQLLEEAIPFIEKSKNDTLLVLHMLGSHGPAYHKRYPDKYLKFKPNCHSNSPQECNDQAVINSYDNTIVYTDHVLSKIIQYLKSHADEYHSFVFYASDHGESLGENGIYLHGLPYLIAPKSQTKVPIIFWGSKNLKKVKNISEESIDLSALHSHDNISHTLLGLFDVKTNVYDRKYDLFYKE